MDRSIGLPLTIVIISSGVSTLGQLSFKPLSRLIEMAPCVPLYPGIQAIVDHEEVVSRKKRTQNQIKI